MLKNSSRAVVFVLILPLASLSPCASTFASPDPTLSGTITLHFAFTPDDPNQEGDQSRWTFAGHSGSPVLGVPAVFDISAIPGPGILSWSNSANWSTFPLNTSGLTINQTGSGSFTAIVNGNQANLNALGGFGPNEATTHTGIDFINISSPGYGSCPDCVFSLFSNFADTHFNVTLPAGAHLNNDQGVTLQNLTVNSGASMENELQIIRQNLTNHGSGNFGGTVQGNFINDAIALAGNVANTRGVILQGQLLNTGELYVTNYFETQAATSNSGKMTINGGQYHAKAAFANNGTLQLSASNSVIYGPATFTNNATFQWTGGSINGPFVNTSAAFTISGTDFKLISGATLVNQSTITQSGGSGLEMNVGGTLTNQAGALYNITDDSYMTNGFEGGTFANAGTLRKSGGSLSLIGPKINNTGLIQVDTGVLRFTGGGKLQGGAMSFGNGAEVQLEAGIFNVEGANSASGNGILRITTGTVDVEDGMAGSFTSFTGGAKLVVSGGRLKATDTGVLTLNLGGASTVLLETSGRLGGTGSTVNTGNFLWTGGSIEGNVLNQSASFTIEGDQMGIFGSTLTNNGTITHFGGDPLDSGGGVGVGGFGTLANNGLFDITDNSDIIAGFNSGSVVNAGTLRKSGGTGVSRVVVPTTNTGTIAVRRGILQFHAGPLTLNDTSTLDFSLGGATPAVDFGQLEVLNTLSLDGKLRVTLEAGYTPTPGTMFDILDWTNQGSNFAFDVLDLPGGGLTWNTSQLYTDGILTVGGLLGDYNHNNKVDAADFTVWRNSLNQVGIALAADGNLDGVITRLDYNIWKANYGQPSGSGAASSTDVAVPEPASGLYVAAAILLSVLAFGRPMGRGARCHC